MRMKRTSECSDRKTLDLEFGFSVLEFFDSIVFMVLEIENFEYCTVSSFANFIDDLVLGSYIVDPQRGMFAGIHEFSQVFIYLKI
jgi:hypothetical protein